MNYNPSIPPLSVSNVRIVASRLENYIQEQNRAAQYFKNTKPNKLKCI